MTTKNIQDVVAEGYDVQIKVSGERVSQELEVEKLIVGITEQIVILYANHSGRESDNRGQFRKDVEKVVRTTLTQLVKEVEVGERDLTIQCLSSKIEDDETRTKVLSYLQKK